MARAVIVEATPFVRAAQVVSGPWRAMPDGTDGIHGHYGDLVSVSYRLISQSINNCR